MKSLRNSMVLLTAAVLTAVMGCNIEVIEYRDVPVTYELSGEIVDARESEYVNVGSVDVELFDAEGNSVASTTADSSGDFSFSDIEGGEYTLKAEKTGWFIPEQTVVASGSFATIPNPIPAFQLDPADDGGISFILMWETAQQDLDLLISYTTGDNTLTAGDMPYGDMGAGIPNKEVVYWNNQESHSDWDWEGQAAVTMDRDVIFKDAPDSYLSDPTAVRTGYGPETTTLRFIPYVSDTGPAVSRASDSANDDNGLLAAFGDSAPSSFDWVGYSNIYVDLYGQDPDSSLDESLQDAKPVLYIIQTIAGDNATKGSSEMSYNLLGTIEAQFDTQTAVLARVNFLMDGSTEYFQILPNYQAYPQGPGPDDSTENLRSVTGGQQILGVRGRTRN